MPSRRRCWTRRRVATVTTRSCGTESPSAWPTCWASASASTCCTGGDVARALSRDWAVGAGDARLVLAGRAAVAAPAGRSGHHRRCPCQLRPQGPRRGARHADRQRRHPAGRTRRGRAVDCQRAAPDPVALLLVAYGRRSQWVPVLAGKLLGVGPKPWLGSVWSATSSRRDGSRETKQEVPAHAATLHGGVHQAEAAESRGGGDAAVDRSAIARPSAPSKRWPTMKQDLVVGHHGRTRPSPRTGAAPSRVSRCAHAVPGQPPGGLGGVEVDVATLLAHDAAEDLAQHGGARRASPRRA